MTDTVEHLNDAQVSSIETATETLAGLDRAFASPEALALALQYWPHFVERHRELVTHRDQLEATYSGVTQSGHDIFREEAAGATELQAAAMRAELSRSMQPWRDARNQAISHDIGRAIVVIERTLAVLLQPNMQNRQVIATIRQGDAEPIDLSYMQRAEIVLRGARVRTILDDHNFFESCPTTLPYVSLLASELRPRPGESPAKTWHGSIEDLFRRIVRNETDFTRRRDSITNTPDYPERLHVLTGDNLRQQYQIDAALALALDELKQGTYHDAPALIRYHAASRSSHAQHVLLGELEKVYGWLEARYQSVLKGLGLEMQTEAESDTAEGLQRRLRLAKVIAQTGAAYEAIQLIHDRELQALGARPATTKEQSS